jgi:hypothetical protein
MSRFVVWMVPGYLIAFGAVAILSIGFPFLVAGLGVFVWLYIRGPGWPHDLGLVAGVGAVALLVAFLNRADGNPDPQTWALAGIGLVSASVLPYVLIMRRRCRSAA